MVDIPVQQPVTQRAFRCPVNAHVPAAGYDDRYAAELRKHGTVEIGVGMERLYDLDLFLVDELSQGKKQLELPQPVGPGYVEQTDWNTKTFQVSRKFFRPLKRQYERLESAPVKVLDQIVQMPFCAGELVQKIDQVQNWYGHTREPL
jgi:hypothetical protein